MELPRARCSGVVAESMDCDREQDLWLCCCCVFMWVMMSVMVNIVDVLG